MQLCLSEIKSQLSERIPGVITGDVIVTSADMERFRGAAFQRESQRNDELAAVGRYVRIGCPN